MDWSSVTSQNPWWENEKAIEIDEKVSYAIKKKPAFLLKFLEGNYLILGPRQIGKTTYLKLCIRELIKKGVNPKHCLYFVCNLVMTPQEVVDIVDLFKKSGGKYVFFDEISFVPNWERAVKQLLEVEALSKGMNLYFTGSTTLELQKERFPGRPIKIREFLPLTFRDFCELMGSESLKRKISERIKFETIIDETPRLLTNQEEIQKLFQQYIACGGFLRAIYELTEKGRISEETYQIYWDWIVGDITRLGLSERTLSAVLKGVVKMYSSSFSLSSLAKEVEIPSHVTVRNYLEILESLYVLRSYWKEYDKTPFFRKERKVYFIDPFIYHVASLKTLGIIQETTEMPKIVEGIMAELMKRDKINIKFFRGKKEIDFVSKNTGIEVKWRENVEANDFPKINFKNKILLSKNTVNLKDEVKIIPASAFAISLQ